MVTVITLVNPASKPQVDVVLAVRNNYEFWCAQAGLLGLERIDLGIEDYIQIWFSGIRPGKQIRNKIIRWRDTMPDMSCMIFFDPGAIASEQLGAHFDDPARSVIELFFHSVNREL